MSRYNPPPYSPHYDFIALRPMTIQGVEVQRGEAIDKSHFKEQRLRQMFDARMIAPAGFAEFPKPAYLDLGRGKADKLAKEIAAEEAAKDSAKGQGHASAASNRAAAKSNASAVKKPTRAPSPPPAKKAAKSKLAAKSARNKRAA